jgi:hypothetical protein
MPDGSNGCCSARPVWLREEAVAEIVTAALHQRDGEVYRLDAYGLMPNQWSYRRHPVPQTVQSAVHFTIPPGKGRRADLD